MLIQEAEKDAIQDEPGLQNSLLENFQDKMIIIEDDTFDQPPEENLDLSPSPSEKAKQTDAECKVKIFDDFIPDKPISAVKTAGIDPRTGKPSNAKATQPPDLTDKDGDEKPNLPRPLTR